MSSVMKVAGEVYDNLIGKLGAWQDRCEERYGGILIQVSPLPWDWRLSFFRDDIDRGYFDFSVGPVTVRLSLRIFPVDRSKLPGIDGYGPHQVIYDEVQDWSGVSDISKGASSVVMEGLPPMLDWQKRVYEREGWKRNDQGVWEKPT